MKKQCHCNDLFPPIMIVEYIMAQSRTGCCIYIDCYVSHLVHSCAWHMYFIF